MQFGGRGSVSVDWFSEVDGFGGLIQKATNSVMTQRGTDDIISDRGTDALKETLSHGAYDLMAIQHTLNYAAAKAAADVKLFEISTDKAYRLQGIRMRLAGILGNAAKVEIIVTNAAGHTTSSVTDIV
jgi:hypothetical protein